MNALQKAFITRLMVFLALFLAGLVLMFIADSHISDMESMADTSGHSWLSTASGWLFAAAVVMSIATLRYGRRHEAAIRERALTAVLLKIFRTLFWLACAASALAAAALIWLALHLGPVR